MVTPDPWAGVPETTPLRRLTVLRLDVDDEPELRSMHGFQPSLPVARKVAGLLSEGGARWAVFEVWEVP